MTRTHDDIDPITLEILRNSLRSITDESYVALTKAAYSTNIKERRDHSIALTDTQGRLVVQSENSLPIHLASMLGMMEQLLDKYAEQDFAEGDIFVANDPYVAGGTHLPDVNLAMPAFVDGKLLGFVCNIAHHADIGGMTPGSMAGGMSEIYQEGLRIPLVRLFKAGELVQDIFDLLLLNVRVPHERRGDYFAQVAACRLGSRRLGEMAQRYGRAMLAQSFDAIMDRTEARLRDSIRTVPDGVYEFTDLLDNDGMGTSDIPISVRVDVAGENIAFDFTGTGPQMKGNFNMTFNAAQSAVYYVLKAMLDPDLPNNHGLIRAVEISAPLGTLVNAVHPAAVAGRANTSQRVVDVLIGALWAEGVVAEIVLFWLGNRLLSRFGAANLLALGAAAGIIRWTAMGFSDALWVALLTQALHAFTFGAAHLGAMHFIARAAPEGMAATAQSLHGAVGAGIAVGLVMAVAGLLYENFANGAYFFMAAIACVSLLAALLLAKIWDGKHMDLS